MMSNILSKASVAALVLGAGLAFSGSTADAAVINSSFEMDAGVGITNGNNFADMVGASGTDSWDIFTSVPGWTVTGGDGLELQTANTIPLTPFDGNYYAELDGNQNTSIAQSVFLASGRYNLTFAYSPRDASVTTNIVSFGIGTLFADSINGPSATVPQGAWTEVAVQFVVGTTGNYNLFFDGAGESDSIGGFIDNVQISAVPLPAAGFLLFGALGGLAAMRRRRKPAA